MVCVIMLLGPIFDSFNIVKNASIVVLIMQVSVNTICLQHICQINHNVNDHETNFALCDAIYVAGYTRVSPIKSRVSHMRRSKHTYLGASFPQLSISALLNELEQVNIYIEHVQYAIILLVAYAK